MNFTCERPYAFWLLLLLIPALVISTVQYRRIVKKITFFSIKNDTNPGLKRVKRFPLLMAFRTIFRTIAWIMLVLAFSSLSWGTYLEPVTKTGSSVAFVFDISYSMMARDAQKNTTRLEAASKYASMLLSHMDEVSFSVVLAKGDGVCVVPVTEDKAICDTLFESLSPSLISTGGTSLGKGIKKAIESFPKNSSKLSTIWLFTDGEETDSLLEGAVSEAIKKGISVCIIGFGSENGAQVLAGDGKTRIQTSLKADRMREVCASALSKTHPEGKMPLRAGFVDSRESGSALKVLSYLKGEKNLSSPEEDSYLTYEVCPVRRDGLFSFLALLFFALSFVITEFDIEAFYFKKKKTALSSLMVFCAVTGLFTSCSTHFDGSVQILEGTWSWYKHKYSSATASFYRAMNQAKSCEDEGLLSYAVYNLGVTYLMQNEDGSSLLRLAEIDAIGENAPQELRFRSWYNRGILAYRRGDYDEAARNFREALKIDGKRVNAKINLELSLRKKIREAENRENMITPVSEKTGSNSMENSVFSRIRENDINRWKNNAVEQQVSGAEDY